MYADHEAEDSSPREFNVGVSFFAEDFVLTVIWSTDDGAGDETRAAAAAEWFSATHGFDPAVHALRVTVEPLAQP